MEPQIEISIITKGGRSGIFTTFWFFIFTNDDMGKMERMMVFVYELGANHIYIVHWNKGIANLVRDRHFGETSLKIRCLHQLHSGLDPKFRSILFPVFFEFKHPRE
jgi:hypothetical protein